MRTENCKDAEAQSVLATSAQNRYRNPHWSNPKL